MKIRHCLALVTLAGCVQAASAQVQVRDLNAPRNGNVQPQASGGNTEVLVNMNNRLEALEQEVQTLRGIVEEQAYQIKRMQAEQKDRYLDLDRRLSASSNPSNKNPASNAPVAPPPSLDASSAAANSAATVATIPSPSPAPGSARDNNRRTVAADDNPLDEQQLYRNALNLLLDDQKPEESKPRALEAINLFQTYIEKYPKGRTFTNALYWQGGAYLIVGNPAKARDVLSRLVTEFPTDAKAADAMVKLGDAYKQLGDKAKAGETWKNVKARYPDADDEIKKADSYLKSL